MEDNFIEDWNQFLAPYEQAVEELKLKLKNIRKEFRSSQRHTPIEFVTGRVKTKESILEKMAIRNIKPEDFLIGVQDIAGIRIMCQFVEDIYEVAHLLQERNDFKVLLVRDYIKNHKASGYRSYHMVVEYPVQRASETISVIVEIQIRTLAMNFWATIEHSLNYKYRGEYPEEILLRLERASEAAFMLDEEMSEIRDEIREAIRIFDRK
ncbi:GTP pyrophosphokinase family protein [Tuanshanicoccus lijuaniae]|nr:GTP pyrophosphokinase family protein [Aerococcaceae bacterium zg-1292]MBF6625034.1 GTP pyrophosphokinase family protein [Aerococcaceae bacterium zg-BR9]MBF6978149.1 GTP pyrophosphokinase family protein [Aerococcaceae bacterium zg-BR22]MBS4456284.1 GTP pyrophosphokinase family protein [Aerococcaceae bacterium zg-A91]MBS4458129.1 GTP pyrophosphokinase family protein [Aerococcaceae bacterium zg-BR33]